MRAGVSEHYVLIAGSTAREGGGTVATFSDEGLARRAFVNQRLRAATTDAWGRLATVDPSGRARVLCWFGPAPAAPSTSATATTRNTRKGNEMRRTLTAPAERQEERIPHSLPPATADKRRRRQLGIVLLTAAAVGGGLWLAADDDPRPAATNRPAVQSSVPPAFDAIPVGYEPSREEQVVYPPGTTRQWDSGAGLHQVTVIAGMLSVEDGRGYRRHVAAGDSYAAGWSPYTATNRTPEPVSATVRYLQPSANDNTAPAPND
jgi:hypothetical protein